MKKLLFAIFLALMANVIAAMDYYACIVVFNQTVPIYADSTGLDTTLCLYQEQEGGVADSFYTVRFLEKSNLRYKVLVNSFMRSWFGAKDTVGWIDKKYIGVFEHSYPYHFDQGGYCNILYDEPDETSRPNYVFIIPSTPLYVDDFYGNDYYNDFYKVHFWCDSLRFDGWICKYNADWLPTPADRILLENARKEAECRNTAHPINKVTHER